MFSIAFFNLIAVLYYLCFLLLAGLTLFINFLGKHRARIRLRRTFLLLALSLLLWQTTLFLEPRSSAPSAQLWLGRLNFAVVAVAAYLVLRFVQEISVKDGAKSQALPFWLLLETIIITVITLTTSLIDNAEHIDAGRAITTFGPLFPVYLVHVLCFLTVSLGLVVRKRRLAKNRSLRNQLTLVGAGTLATGGIAMISNALLPYHYGDFRFCDVGTISTLFFTIAIAYATLIHGLFEPRILFRETVVFGILLAFVLGAYSSTVFLVTQNLTSGAEKLTQFAVLLIAFSVDPLRRHLEKMTDHLLFAKRGCSINKRKRRANKSSQSTTISKTLMHVFPWWRL